MTTMEEIVPQDSIFRKIDEYIDFIFIYDEVKDYYCLDNDKYSIDLVVLFKLVFIQAIDGIKSMRKTCDKIKVDAEYRWFLGIPFGHDTPKNQSSVRVFKINLFMYFRFCFLKVYYKQKYGMFSKDYFIFGGPKPLARTTIDRYKKIAYEKANLPCITQHEFRHSYITRKIHKKTPIDYVSRTVGHSKPSTTLDVYLHHEKNTLNVF